VDELRPHYVFLSTHCLRNAATAANHSCHMLSSYSHFTFDIFCQNSPVICSQTAHVWSKRIVNPGALLRLLLLLPLLYLLLRPEQVSKYGFSSSASFVCLCQSSAAAAVAAPESSTRGGACMSSVCYHMLPGGESLGACHFQIKSYFRKSGDSKKFFCLFLTGAT
jgi:hypothetical protein